LIVVAGRVARLAMLVARCVRWSVRAMFVSKYLLHEPSLD
jgi:hypothetical protein